MSWVRLGTDGYSTPSIIPPSSLFLLGWQHVLGYLPCSPHSPPLSSLPHLRSRTWKICGNRELGSHTVFPQGHSFESKIAAQHHISTKICFLEGVMKRSCGTNVSDIVKINIDRIIINFRAQFKILKIASQHHISMKICFPEGFIRRERMKCRGYVEHMS